MKSLEQKQGVRSKIGYCACPFHIHHLRGGQNTQAAALAQAMDTLLPLPIEETSSAPHLRDQEGEPVFVSTPPSCREIPVNVWPLVGVLLVAQSCLTLCNPVDYSVSGSSVQGILQARILECLASSQFLLNRQGEEPWSVKPGPVCRLHSPSSLFPFPSVLGFNDCVVVDPK